MRFVNKPFKYCKCKCVVTCKGAARAAATQPRAMGAGASSTNIQKDVASASEADLAAAVQGVPDDVWEKLVAARAATAASATKPDEKKKEDPTPAATAPVALLHRATR